MRSWWAPGRVNLIGEHTDYNEGFVLPLAIQHGCTASVDVSATPTLTMTSAQMPDPVTITMDVLRPGAVRGWAAYIAGVVWALQTRGAKLPGLRIHVDSDVPLGAGLSSSAALVCSVAAAVNDALDLGLPVADLVTVTRSAENDFVGAPTGGMDQLAAMESIAGHALFCDMRTLTTSNVPFPLDHLSLLVIDSHAEHRHADGAYRDRRTSCEKAAQILGVPALRDIDGESLPDALRQLPSDVLRRRVRHVVTENDRVLHAVALLQDGKLREIGPLLTGSHASMRDDYQITVPEVDIAVETILAAGAHGARMTGGGFGGCVIALLDTDTVEPAIQRVRQVYATRGFHEPAAFVAQAAAGAHPVERNR